MSKMTTPSPSPSEFFENIKYHHQNIDDNFEQPSIIIPKLKAYQRRVVKWMIERENHNDLVKSDCSAFSGGILADETGLGKTLEMLCCIVINTSPPEFNSKKIVHKNNSNYPQNISISLLQKPSTAEFKSAFEKALDENVVIINCSCIIVPQKTHQNVCGVCGKIHHNDCVHFKPIQEIPYLCANLEISNEKIQCKATLIVVSQSNLNKWILDTAVQIAKPGLKVIVYNGMHLDGYIQPILFVDYDVVITSFENLLKDLHYGLENHKNTSSLRHPKKYNYLQSPLSHVKWWRICLDGGNANKIKFNKVSRVMSSLKSIHRWAITSTPIQKSLNDLNDILKYLDVDPYYDRTHFFGVKKTEASLVYHRFSKIIWRNSLKDVISELNLPKLTFEIHWLILPEHEKYFYQNQHDFHAETFSKTVTATGLETHNISLKDIGLKPMSSMIDSLRKIIKACVHPQAINQSSLKVKCTMTMDEIMDIILEKHHTQCSFWLRSLLIDNNRIAGMYLIISEPISAIKHYREVLNLMEFYSNIQDNSHIYAKFHALYHLAKIQGKYTELSHTLSDLDLKNNVKLLEEKCHASSDQRIKSTLNTIQLYSKEIKNLTHGRKVNYSNWWSEVLKLIFSPTDFIMEVQSELEDYHVPSDPNIANKLNSVRDIFNILSVWLADLDSARITILSMLTTLKETYMHDLIDVADKCHLSFTITKKKNMCIVCKIKNKLQSYEPMLFYIPNTQENVSIYKVKETTYESICEGPWKISQKEFLLMKLFEYGQTKLKDNICKDATEHVKILNLLRAEFKYFMLLCAHFIESIDVGFNIKKAKEKLWPGSWPIMYINPPDFKGSLRQKNKFEGEMILRAHDEIENLLYGIRSIKINLENSLAQLLYLKKLKNNESSTGTEPCPICTYVLDSGCAVLPCGHNVCFKCVIELTCRCVYYECGLMCPMCRNSCHMNNLFYAKSSQEDKVTDIIIGSFSSKIKYITLKLKELIAEDPNVKVLVFSTLDYSLKVLSEALELNLINYRLLNPMNYNETLIAFKTNSKINALLMNLNQAAEDINLSEATIIFFMDPTIEKANESIAINQIHRLGQTKPMFVHHFIVRDSVEENIIKMFPRDQLDKCDNVTLSQLISIFKRD